MAISVSEAWAGARVKRIDAEVCPDWVHDGQRRVWESKARVKAVVCGAQSGKSTLQPRLILRYIQRTAKYYHRLKEYGEHAAVYLVIGPTTEVLKNKLLPLIDSQFSELGLGKMNYSGKPVFRFSREGSIKLCGEELPIEIAFCYSNDPSNLEAYTALGYFWDEAGQKENKESAYEAAQRRISVAVSLRETEGLPIGEEYYTSTPYEWGWFKRRVCDLSLREESDADYFNWPTWTNPTQSESAIRQKLKDGMELWRWEMMYEGKWTRPAGAVFPDFDARVETKETGETSVVKPFKIPDNWKIYTGWDFGSANTACAIFAFDPEREIFYVVKSYHGAGGHASTHITRVEQFLKRKDGTTRRINASFGGAGSEDNERDKYQIQGFTILKPLVTGADSVSVGIQTMNALISTKKLKVFSTEVELIDQMSAYSHKLDDNGDPLDEIQDKAIYHRIDAARYAAVSLADFPTLRSVGANFDPAIRV